MGRNFVLATATALGLVAACGSSDELVPLDDGLLPPAAMGRPNAGSSGASGSPSSSSSSGSADAATGSSSGAPPVPTPTCDAADSSRLPVAVPGLPAEAREVSLTGDELNAFFVMETGTGQRVFGASRSSLATPFAGALQLGSGVNGGAAVMHVFVTDDGLELYATRGEGDSRTVYRSTRSTLAEPFGEAQPHRGNATNELVTRDGSARLFSRKHDDFWELQVARPATADESSLQPFGHPQLPDGWIVASVYPAWFAPNEKTLWFYSQEIFVRPPFQGGIQRRDFLRTSQWDEPTAAWSVPVETALRVTWISPDGCRLYGVTASGIEVQERIPTP